MPKYRIITPIGTSIFTNYQKKSSDLNDKIKDIEKKRYREWENYKQDIESIKKSICKKTNDDASAEIKSVLKLKEKYNGNNIIVHLIATDTILSVLAGEILLDYFMKKKINVNFETDHDIINGLQVFDAEEFEKKGLNNFIKRLSKILKSSTNRYMEEVIFNITGGYKSLIPYLSLMSQIYQIPSYYIFEKSDILIEIPQAPIDYDFSIIEENYIEFLFLKNKDVKKEDFAKEFNLETFNELKKYKLIEEFGNFIKLTPLGLLLKEKYDEMNNSGKYYKNKIIGNLIELKLYKYFVNKVGKSSNVEHSKRIEFNNNTFEIDLYIKNEKTIRIIEVKPGGNVPIWEKKKGKESIEYRFKEGAFKQIIDNNKRGKKLNFEIYLYHYKKIHKSVINQIGKLSKNVTKDKKNVSIQWFWLEIPKNYSTNTIWNINDNNIITI
ncbi:MAG: hypothetical protein K9W44_00520 [Candidatus Lokiarchaeota archaeon]|nr:hypothetical protein [Candidatus Harpocratesius repetitus]